jgi:hypothetical protein
VLLKDLPALRQRQPQRLTDFERRQMFLASRESTIDYDARSQLKAGVVVGLVDVRIVAGEHEDRAMFSSQLRTGPDQDVFVKVPVDMRHRKRQYHDSNCVHLWTKTSDKGTCRFV